MSSLHMRQLLAERAPDASAETAAPLCFDLDDAIGRGALQDYLIESPPRFVHDTLPAQLGELIELREPERKLTPGERQHRIQMLLDGRDPLTYGRWILFPWSSRLVHVLPPDEYREVRTARNRYKITHAEQVRLARARIGVVGLSVGNAAAVTFALEGIGGEFRIADFDELSLSNLNRLRGGAHDLGMNKTVLAARAMYELDPYLHIRQFPRGVHADNMDEFLVGDGRLDLLVEECDDLFLKIAIRERCRDLRIPVIMDTSDRGLLDIERFDLEPRRPILHGLVGDMDATQLRDLSTLDKVPIVLDILGGPAMSTRMAASLPEVDQTITSWPQLASGVALGGAITADAARRILLGEYTESGRYYVDVEDIVRNGTAMFVHGAPPPVREESAPVAVRGPRSTPLRPAVNSVADGDAIRWIVGHAILSPSAHNSQPWQYVWRDGVLECRHDPAHDLPSLDFERTATWLTFGCVAESIDIAARAIGLVPEYAAFPDPSDPQLVMNVRFHPGPVEDAPLLRHLTARVTNRRRDGRTPLTQIDADSLDAVASAGGCMLHLAREHAALEEIAGLVGACDRIAAMGRDIHRDTMSGYRWTRADAERHRDGLDVATLELTPAERAGLRLLSEWEIMAALRRLGGGRALEDVGRKLVAHASAVGLLTTPGIAPTDYLRGGRIVQRLWLTATSLGLAFQPITGLPYLFARMERGNGTGMEAWQSEELRLLRPRYLRVFGVPAGHAELFLFRVARAGAPTAISLRRPLETVLTLH